MDLTSILGPIIGIGLILVGMIMEGGHVSSLVQPTALLIVGGGTLGTVVAAFPGDHLKSALKGLGLIFKPPKVDHETTIKELVELCQYARKNGIMALEPKAKAHPDPFTRKGLTLVVDGVDPAVLTGIMETELHTYEEDLKKSFPIFEAGGGFAPTIGIIGAVLGLIHVMSNLDDPTKLGAGIAVAFVATIYGLAIANIFCLPMANKLKIRAKELAHEKQMILEGLIALQNGENPHFLGQRLRAFVGGEHAAEHEAK